MQAGVLLLRGETLAVFAGIVVAALLIGVVVAAIMRQLGHGPPPLVDAGAAVDPPDPDRLRSGHP